jgi:hypothetical protein
MGTWKKDQKETLKKVKDKLSMDTFEEEEILKLENLFKVAFDLPNRL